MPGKKRKSKNPGTAPSGTVYPSLDLSALLAMIRFSGDAKNLAPEIAGLLCVPDLNTTRGLKQCHQDFDYISARLEQLFVQSRGCESDKASADILAAAIIAIYGRMSRDTVLRVRIFSEAKFWQKAVSLLHSDIARSRVMPIMSEVTHISDSAIIEGLAGFTSEILDCAEGHLHDLKYAESTVCVLSHSTVVVLDHGSSAHVEHVPLARIIQFFLTVVRLPSSTSLSFDHLLYFCSRVTLHRSFDFHAIPGFVDFLVACTRSQDLSARNAALRSLIGLSIPERPTRPAASTDSETMENLTKYGTKSRQMREFLLVPKSMDLVDAFAETHNLSDFGNGLVDIILAWEPGISGYFDVDGTGALDLEGIPRLNVDVLRLSADAVRRGSEAQSEVKADILQLEFLLVSRRDDEATALARSAIERNPSVAFFYYVLVAGRNTSDITSARFAERGLQCPDLTPFLREELLHHSASSLDRIVGEMLSSTPSQIHLQEVVALTQKALSSANAYIDIAPPDSIELPTMIALTIHLNFLVRGHTLSDGCEELQTARDQLPRACAMARSLSTDPLPRLCLAVETLLARTSTADELWKPVVSRHPSKEYTNINPNPDLAGWLEKHESDDPAVKHFGIRGVNTTSHNFGALQLPCCSSCNRPSAALKRCSGCLETRYCNSECQTRHWKFHRKTCKGKR
ncbi:hypothetical protein C8R46DRAFT_1184863 [Mycena filopes]|nr:hypothetical protein C8R46DRAFT_1184863 [Mycena filopes]